MAALGLRFRAWFRRRRGYLLVATLLIGAVAGLAMGLVSGTRRTASAPDRYTSWAGGDPELEIVQQDGAPLTDDVAAIPGVKRVGGITFVTSFLRGPDGSIVFRPNPFAGSDRIGGARVVEGRHTDPEHPDEFTVNPAMAQIMRRRLDADVGDRFDVVSFSRTQVESNRGFNSGEPPAVPPFPARWVGVIENPTDFEEATPSIYYSEAFLGAHPTVGVVQSIMQVHLADGADPRRVLRAVQSLPGGESAFVTGARIVSDESRRAVRFQTTALLIVTTIILIGASIVVVLLVSRAVERSEHEVRTLASLGLRSRDLMVERMLEASVCMIAAMPVALVVARWVTAPFPLGALSAFEPHQGPLLDWTVVGLGLVVMLAAALLGALVAAPGARERSIRRSGSRRSLTLATRGMPLAVGAHYARVGSSGRSRSIAALLVGMVGMAGLVGSVIVGLNLDDMVNTPARWGVNYDELFGNPYVETDTDIVAPVAGQQGVAQLTAVHIGSLTIDGRETPTLAIDPVKGDLVPHALEGRAPRHGEEIGLGEEIAHRLGVGVGDSVVLGGSTDSVRTARVVGIVVTADSAGGGAAVPFALYRALNPTATRNVLLATFVPGTRDAVIKRLAEDNFSPPDALPTPTSVQALRRVLPAPTLLVIGITVLLLVGCAFLLTLTVRAQRHDFAVLRALGATRSQLRSIVHWQATLVVVAVLVVGIPLGVALGRLIVQLLTTSLGVVPGVELPVLLLLGVAVTAVAVANLLAVPSARRAARPAPALLNRDE